MHTLSLNGGHKFTNDFPYRSVCVDEPRPIAVALDNTHVARVTTQREDSYVSILDFFIWDTGQMMLHFSTQVFSVGSLRIVGGVIGSDAALMSSYDDDANAIYAELVPSRVTIRPAHHSLGGVYNLVIKLWHLDTGTPCPFRECRLLPGGSLHCRKYPYSLR